MITEAATKLVVDIAVEEAAKPAASALKLVPGIRGVIAAAKRGRGVFAIPTGKILILYPSYPRTTGEHGVFAISHNDKTAASEVESLFAAFGFREKAHWRSIAIEEALDDTERQNNLVVLCGSNAMWHEVQRNHQNLLRTIQYRHSPERAERSFVWENRLYRSSAETDYAILAVKPNPYNAKKRLIVLFGLRDIGTRGAARAFAAKEYANLRKEIGKLATKGGELEVLLKVTHDSQRKRVRHVSIASDTDADREWNTSKLLPLPSDTRTLNQIYRSLQETPRPVLLSDFEYEVKYTTDYTAKFRWQFTWACANADVVVQGMKMGGSEALERIEEVEFHAHVTDGPGGVAVLAATNELRLKEFLLFPIPPIMKGDAPRRIEATAVWRGVARNLQNIGGVERATCTVFKHAVDPVNKASFRIVLDIDGDFEIQHGFDGNPKAAAGIFNRNRPYVYEELSVRPGREWLVSILRVR